MGVAVVVMVALTWPLLFTSSGFNGDWMHHLWRVWHQSESIRAGDFPSLFLNSSYSVFDPVFAFYGGTLYAVAGTLALALGGAPLQAYVLIYVLDLAAAFGGWYWLARMSGVGRWLALVPGLVFVTSAYYVMLVYVRGDWPEFTGVSMIALMVAAGLSVLRAERLRLPAAGALALSAILFFGSHNITILLGLTTLALTGLAVVLCVPDARRQLTRAGVLRVAGVVVPSALVSAWYLLPLLAYQGRTRIASNYVGRREVLKEWSGLVSIGHLFTFSRGSAEALASSPHYAFALCLPVLAIAWVLLGIVMLPRRNRRRGWTRLLLICAVMAVLCGVVMTHVGILLALPRVYSMVQFTYRLESYVLLELSAAILAALVLARKCSRGARIWTWMAIPVCAVSLIGAIGQIRAYPSPGSNRYAALKTYAELEGSSNGDYQDVSEPVIDGRGLPTLEISASAIHDGRVSGTVRARLGTLVATNIAAGPYLLSVSGAEPVGLDSETDRLVLRVGSRSAAVLAHASKGPIPQETISVSTGDSLPIVLGRLLTLGALAALLLLLFVVPSVRALARRLRLTALSTQARAGMDIQGAGREVPGRDRLRAADGDAQREAVDGRLL